MDKLHNPIGVARRAFRGCLTGNETMMGPLYLYDIGIGRLPIVALARCNDYLARMTFDSMIACGEQQIEGVNLLGSCAAEQQTKDKEERD